MEVSLIGKVLRKFTNWFSMYETLNRSGSKQAISNYLRSELR
jgi:hypothetical protein